MYDNYVLYIQIGIIKELQKQGVITTEEEKNIIQQLEKRKE